MQRPSLDCLLLPEEEGCPGSSDYPQCSLPAMWETWVRSWIGKIPWRRKWQPTPVFFPGESHGQRSLVGYSPWGLKESDMTERLTHMHVNKEVVSSWRPEVRLKEGHPGGMVSGEDPLPHSWERHPSFQDRMAGLPQALMLGGGPGWRRGSKESFILRPCPGAPVVRAGGTGTLVSLAVHLCLDGRLSSSLSGGQCRLWSLRMTRAIEPQGRLSWE